MHPLIGHTKVAAIWSGVFECSLWWNDPPQSVPEAPAVVAHERTHGSFTCLLLRATPSPNFYGDAAPARIRSTACLRKHAARKADILQVRAQCAPTRTPTFTMGGSSKAKPPTTPGAPPTAASAEMPGPSTPGSSNKRVNAVDTIPTTPGSSKRPKRAKAISGKGNMRKHGVQETAGSFVTKIWEKEAECAAYLGYTRSKGYPGGLARLRGRTADQQGRQHVYQADHNGVKAHRVALVVAQARRSIENARSGADVYTSEEIEKMYAKFDEQEGRVCPRIDTAAELILPKLGPFTNLVECDLEAYTRTLAIIKYLQYSTRAPWDSRFGSQRWDQRLAVTQNHVPLWMQPGNESTPTVAAVAPDDPLKPAGISGPSRPAIRMRPAARREHLFNQVRLAFRLSERQGQIHTLVLFQEGESEEGDDDIEINAATEHWARVQAAVWGPKWDPSKGLLWLIVRPAIPDEVIMEDALPLEMEQILVVKDGDIHPIVAQEVDNTEDQASSLVTDGYSKPVRNFAIDATEAATRNKDRLRYNTHQASGLDTTAQVL
ncbi:hypothetical protein OPT61_g3202 [Boeremia exigua]|uniref:Uncharacterized protein n=1 Tax=Boeremia exigua TaxID=749465 RepID=A0ACC2IIN3_9PLEO|nr:hypothetical protein OPT61_g3202 [Boeremia exigua]